MSLLVAFQTTIGEGRDWTSVGTGTATFVQAQYVAVNLSSSGVGAATFNIAEIAARNFTSSGQGAASFAVAAGVAVTFNSQGTGTATFNQAQYAARTWTAAGAATASFVTAEVAARVWSAAGISTVFIDAEDQGGGSIDEKRDFIAAGTSTFIIVAEGRIRPSNYTPGRLSDYGFRDPKHRHWRSKWGRL